MKDHWESEAAGILKSLLARDDVGYKKLALELAKLGVQDTERALRNKINRGSFSFSFFLSCLVALGYRDLRFTVRPPKPKSEAARETPRIF
jgi:hypothetical protein